VIVTWHAKRLEDVAPQPAGQVRRIELVGLNRRGPRIELLRMRHITVHPQALELATGPAPKGPSLANQMHFLGQGNLLLDEPPELLPARALGGLRSALIDDPRDEVPRSVRTLQSVRRQKDPPA
jgi:hypothetical protein